MVSFEINGSFDKSVLDQELCSTLGAHALSNFNGYFSKLFFGAVRLSYTKSFLPEIVSPVHVHSISPRATFDVVMLSLLQVSLHLKGLGQVVMSIFEQISSEFHDKSNHLIEHFRRLVHVDGQVGLASSKVHFFGLFEVAFHLKFLGFLNLDCAVLAFR